MKHIRFGKTKQDSVTGWQRDNNADRSAGRERERERENERETTITRYNYKTYDKETSQ